LTYFFLKEKVSKKNFMALRGVLLGDFRKAACKQGAGAA